VVGCVSKDGTVWQTNSFSEAQTLARNVLRQKGGPAGFTKMMTCKDVFKTILSEEICDFILSESNRKWKHIIQIHNEKLIQKYPNVSTRPEKKGFEPFCSTELDAFLGILIVCGLHRLNKEPVHVLYKNDGLPLVRAAMSRDRFNLFLKCIRFDNDTTRQERLASDKAAPVSDIWLMLNHNLEKAYKPHECITVDEQIFPFRGHTRFTQYIPSKPSKYGIKVFWASNALTGYPLRGIMYTGKLPDGERQTNIGERMVLDLVAPYRNSGRNITCDNCFY
jgi:hypothetical protein